MTTSKIVNLTPHTLRLANADIEGEFTEVEPSGTIARMGVTNEIDEEACLTSGSIVLYCIEVMGLPRPRAGTIYVVSGIVKYHVPERHDVYTPADLIRDENGRVIYAAGLTQHPPPP